MQTFGTVFNTVRSVSKTAAAILPQGIQGAIAKQTAKAFFVCIGMTREILAIPILYKVISHLYTSAKNKRGHYATPDDKPQLDDTIFHLRSLSKN
jgi:hypothetical protein